MYPCIFAIFSAIPPLVNMSTWNDEFFYFSVQVWCHCLNQRSPTLWMLGCIHNLTSIFGWTSHSNTQWKKQSIH